MSPALSLYVIGCSVIASSLGCAADVTDIASDLSEGARDLPADEALHMADRLQRLQEAEIDQMQKLRSAATHNCLDAPESAEGVNVVQLPCNGSESQSWEVVKHRDRTVSLVNLASKKCLDASEWGQGEQMIQHECHFAENQHWRVQIEGDYLVFENVASNECLDVSEWGRGTHIVQYDCHKQPNQLWYWSR